MHDKSTQRHTLGGRVAELANHLAGCIIHEIRLGSFPPGAVIMAERDLWRWAHELRTANQPPTSSKRQVAVVVLVELDGHRDPGWLAETLIATVSTAGSDATGWHVIHATVHPDPVAIFGDDHDQRASQ